MSVKASEIPLQPPRRRDRRLSNPRFRRRREDAGRSRLEQRRERNAALQVASQKWDSLTINGGGHQEAVARLAAEHGSRITNPELQDRIREIQAEAEARRQSSAERNDQAEQQQTEAKNTTPKARRIRRQSDRETAGGPILNTTPAERRVELESVRQRH